MVVRVDAAYVYTRYTVSLALVYKSSTHPLLGPLDSVYSILDRETQVL